MFWSPVWRRHQFHWISCTILRTRMTSKLETRSRSTRFEKVRMFCSPVKWSQLFGSKVSSVEQNWIDIMCVVFCQLLAVVIMLLKMTKTNCKVSKTRKKCQKVVFFSMISCWSRLSRQQSNNSSGSNVDREEQIPICESGGWHVETFLGGWHISYKSWEQQQRLASKQPGKQLQFMQTDWQRSGFVECVYSESNDQTIALESQKWAKEWRWRG